MSIEALKWALDIGEELDLESPRRLVLIMLGNSADQAGGSLFPSHGYISRRTGLALSTVRAHITALAKAGLLLKEPGRRSDGGQSSNQYRLAMRQPGLALDDTPLLDSGRGVPPAGRGPARQPAGGGEHSKVLKQEEKKGAGQASPSPVTACFEAYRQGIKAAHGAEYPPSASANGILSQVVKKLGAEAALAVVRAYVASRKPFYVQRKHALEILAKDAPTIWIELQQHAGGGKPPAVASLYVEWNDGAQVRLTDYPTDKPELLARRLLKDYASKFATGRARNIHVQVGAARHAFSVKELAA